MPKEDTLDPAKQNPFVHLNFCDTRHVALDLRLLNVEKKLDQILYTLKGNPEIPDDLGIMGTLRDLKRDKKWTYALLTIIGIPTIFMIVQFLMKAG